MKFNFIDYRIGDHFLPALISGDETGLDAQESAELACFVEQTIATHGAGHWSTDDEDGGQFAWCEVSTLYGNCERVRYCVPINEDGDA